MTPTFPSVRKVGLLAMLYFAQGLPFGFQSKGLKLVLTELGVSMTLVTSASLLSLPWLFKPLWAPLVDRHWLPRFGRRTSWIVPMQGLMALAFVAAALSPPQTALSALLVAVFCMNLFAATQDVAVDGLAVDLLSARELGVGNAVQVVGYKIGMIVGGSVLVATLPSLGWEGTFAGLAVLAVLVAVVMASSTEPSSVSETPEEAERLSWSEVVARLKQIVVAPGAGWLLLGVATYKAGESLADPVFEPFLIREAHLPMSQVAGFAAWGMGGSMLGSLAGGLLATRMPLARAVGVAAAGRVLPLVAMAGLVSGVVATEPTQIIVITVSEHFFAGMLTTAMFALMMSRVDRRIGATHFTVLAALEVLGKSPWSVASGAVVEHLGWTPTFIAATALSAAFIVVVPRLDQKPAEVARITA